MHCFLSLGCIFAFALPILAQDAPQLKTVLIDTIAKESLGALRADSMGRLFVAGQDTIYVYEPNADGGHQPRQLLYQIPGRCQVRDIEMRGSSLFVLTPNALYVIPNGVTKRENLQAKKLVWGVPLAHPKQGFRALAWGPQGDLYFAMEDVLGDPQASDQWGHWTFFSQPNVSTPYNGVGGLFRCKPDGSDFRIVARGLRNPSGLVFDRYWNLFSDSLYITPHAYFSLPQRGAAKTSLRPDQLMPMFENTNKQAFTGQSYYDETLLPEEFRHQLLLARSDELLRFSLAARGAGFKASEHPPFPFKKDARPVAITVGRGGRIFAALTYPSTSAEALPDKTELVMITKADDPAAHPFEPYDPTEATSAKLWQELSDASWQRRARAHLELTRRSGDLFNEANRRLLDADADDPALYHLIWLAAMGKRSNLHLLSLLDSADPRVRVQVVRALTEFPEQMRGDPLLTKFLRDENLAVRHAALLAHFNPKIAWNRTVQQLVERNGACSEDPYLRQSAALLLAEKATRKQIEDMCGSFDDSMRLAGVLTAGYRLTLPSATKVLERHLPLAAPRDEAAFWVEDDSGKVDLRKFGRLGSYTIAQHWKADMHTEEQALLFKLLRKMLKDADAPTRREAAYFLSLLNDPRIPQAPP